MPDLLAIISKAVFETDAKDAQPGITLGLDRYNSKNPGLGPLKQGGRLFLVTVRPEEKLWLVGVLEQPKHNGSAWVAPPNQQPVKDISALRSKIRFTSDTGITAKKGALGMSLQTPRTLTEEDVALLLGGAKAKAPPAAKSAAVEKKPAVEKKAAPVVAPSNWSALTAALQSKRYDRALGVALTLWADTRSPALAAFIDALGAQLPAASGGTFSAGLRDASQANLTPLLAQLTTDVRFDESLSRIRALEKLPPDPRIAAQLTSFLTAPPFTAQSSRDFWSSLFEQLTGTQADPRTVSTLKPLLKTYDQVFGATKMGEAITKKIEKLLSVLEPRFAGIAEADVPAEVRALLPKQEAKPKGAPATDLLSKVYANPDDDGARQVYADSLLEKGDPRGDFITLQFRRARGETLSAAEEKQEKALLNKHMKEWLGPLYDITYKDQNVFERGFLSECRMRLLGGKIRLAMNHPGWATVRQIELAIGGTNEHGANLLVQPAMRHLKVLIDAPYDVVKALGEQATEHQLEKLVVGWMPNDEADGFLFNASDWEPLLTGKALPRLRELVLEPEYLYSKTLMSFWKSPLAQRLEKLVLKATYSFDGKIVDDIRSLAPAHLAIDVMGDECVLSLQRTGRMTLKPNGVVPSGKINPSSFGYYVKNFAAAKTVLPITLEGLTDKQVAEVKKLLPRAKLTEA